jgi:hypothetical protein
VFTPPAAITLWQLPEQIEEEFETRWERWLDHADEWQPFFQQLENLQAGDFLPILQTFVSLTEGEREMFASLRRAAEGRAVPLAAPFSGTDQDVALLALGFGRGEPGAVAVPYAEMG